ncbi:MAG TPA: Gfo/Idh/MocA family oxidoreductase [Verrucomicrobiales bacterium]|nr:Gfo/Idh/MocA family oxidoreductase [Verrucomicrobiales bacterium]
MPLPPLTRRSFLRSSSAAALPLVLPAPGKAKPANSRLQHACIGADGQGWSDLENLASHPGLEVVALCDVDASRIERARERFPQARCYQDWRELLEKEGDRVDSLNVSIPDHMHAPVSVSAMRLGKHVFCEKPLTHTVSEARVMRETAEKHQVVTQMGNQIQSAIEYRMAVRMLQDGVIGRIREIHAWSGARFPYRGRPQGADPVPEGLAWDLWLGVAPGRPYRDGIYHPFNWRGWQDFGGGGLGDFGCHILDTPFKAVELTAPLTIRADVPDAWTSDDAAFRENFPDGATVEYEFPGTRYTAGERIRVTWYDGERIPPRELFDFQDDAREIPGGGSLFLGEDGQLLVPHVAGPQLLPYSRNRGLKRPDVDGFSHYHAFVDACLQGGVTGSHFSYAGPLAETTLLGTVALRHPGRELAWDAAALRVTNLEEANQSVHKTYRDGWSLEDLG